MIGYLRGKMTLGFLFFVTETFYKIRTMHDAYSSRAFGTKNINYLLLQLLQSIRIGARKANARLAKHRKLQDSLRSTNH